MEFREKAAVRIKHWMEHNASHLNEYEAFADQLEAAEAAGSAAHIRAMAELTRQTNDCLQRALAALESESA